MEVLYYGTGSLTGNYTDLIATNRSRLLSMSAVLSKISLKRPSGESAKVKHMVLPWSSEKRILVQVLDQPPPSRDVHTKELGRDSKETPLSSCYHRNPVFRAKTIPWNAQFGELEERRGRPPQGQRPRSALERNGVYLVGYLTCYRKNGKCKVNIYYIIWYILYILVV